MKKIVISVLILSLVLAAFASGCTGTESQKTVQPTETQAAVQTEVSADELDWIVWREGSNTLKQLGGYFSYGPNVNGQKFKALKVEVRANHPVTVLFLNDKELSNFEKKMATNTGEFTPVERYDDVNYKVLECYSDDYLNVVIWNQGTDVVTTDFYIWYKNMV
ncbi:MAG: hypothetical protein PHP13_02065 [Methanomicrobium sp.]|nr:hypothetical protein [Methanomicrobium sp.]